MNRFYSTFFKSKLVIAGFVFGTQLSLAQGYDDPLTVQGLDQNTMHSAASRGAGGITIGIQNDVSLMFTNPALLQSLKHVQFSAGGLYQNSDLGQVQRYSPLKYYSNFSLLMEGLTGNIGTPAVNSDTTLNAGDTVQRAYDNIAPNWSRSRNKSVPVQAFVGVPFSIGEIKFSAGIGAAQYADLDHYYQNNNVLSPAIGNERPLPVALPASDSTPVETNWASYYRSREGTIDGYGVALSVSLSEKLSFGISGMMLNGTTDDVEQRIERGRLVFFRQYFRLDSVYGHITKTGTSDYSGQEFTLSGTYRGPYVNLGFSVKPPTTITRKYNSQVLIDTNGVASTSTESGEDNIELPWRGTVGLSIAVTDNLLLGLEYEIRSYASAVYTKSDGTEVKPWLSSSVLRIGAEYNPLAWLALRAGVREQAEVFEPTGNPLIGEPVHHSIYSAGCGVMFEGIRFNVTYEYAAMKYNEAWQTNINYNTNTRNSIIADVAYTVSWM